jgi:hypothetical protein
MIGQMLHLRAAAIADAYGHLMWIGRRVGHRKWDARQTESPLINLRHFREKVATQGSLPTAGDSRLTNSMRAWGLAAWAAVRTAYVGATNCP